MTEQELRAAVAEYDAEMINAIIVSDDDGCMIEWNGNTPVTWYVFGDFIRRDEGCHSQESDVLISHAVTMRAMDAATKAFEEALTLEAEKAEREAQEPVAYVTDEPSPNPEPIAWLAGKRAGMKLYAEPPIPRVEQEPVAWVLFDDIFIAPKDMQDDPPNLECMKPLYAHPLALREPTDDECREIADRFLCEVANAARGVRTGRAMFNAVREVMTK